MEDQLTKQEILELFKKARETGQHKRWVLAAKRLLLLKNRRESALTGEDIIEEIFYKVLTGDRKFRSDINLDQYVMETIKSIVDNEVRKDLRMVREKIQQPDGGNEDSVSIVDTLEQEAFIGQDKELETAEMYDLFWDACSDDEEALEFLIAFMDGNTKTADLAKAMGKTPEGITNIKKRIKRRVDKKLLQ